MTLDTKDQAFIKNLSTEMKTQDTRCTAQPYALLLTEENVRLVPDGYSDKYMAMWNEDEYSSYDELMKELEEYYADEDGIMSEHVAEAKLAGSFSGLQGNYEAEQLEIVIHAVTIEQEANIDNMNLFLTEKAYEAHLARNGHNLKKPQSYGVHLCRNEEMERLYEIIHKLAEQIEVVV